MFSGEQYRTISALLYSYHQSKVAELVCDKQLLCIGYRIFLPYLLFILREEGEGGGGGGRAVIRDWSLWSFAILS